ncbi:MAG: acyl-CoA synthetase [Acidimicrobiia bacterium]
MENVADVVRRHIGNPRVALRFEDASWTWDEYVRACAQRAAYLLDRLPAGAPPHVGVLLENVPDYMMWLGATALTGTVLVGINPTRRGAELERDIAHTDCQVGVTEERHRSLLDGLDLAAATDRVLVVDDAASASALDAYAGAPVPDVPVDESGIYNLLFTSGTSGAPKACILSQGRLMRSSTILTANVGLNADSVLYVIMPLFHSNAIITAFCPWLISGGTAALRRRFSASGFLPDVRRYGVTYVNYVGKPLSYILATPEHPDDADNPLQIAFGNEAAELDIERFAKRFGCVVVDSYGSTEGGANVVRSPDMPKGSLGMPADGIVILDPETLTEKPRARFDADGRLANPDECIGEIVNLNGAPGFEGYYNNDEANAQRVRNGWYWSGDLGYRDEEGWIYFGGRDFEWMRVDGENFAAAPIERILARHPDVVLAAVYAVPDEEVGDQVMATLLVRPGTAFDPEDFDDFLGEQTDLGTKWSPRYVRITEDMPVTESQKPIKRQLRRERWDTAEPVFWRAEKGAPLRRMTDDDRAALHEAFERHGRLAALDVG